MSKPEIRVEKGLTTDKPEDGTIPEDQLADIAGGLTATPVVVQKAAAPTAVSGTPTVKLPGGLVPDLSKLQPE